LELTYARQAEELRSTRERLDHLTATISSSVRTTAIEMRAHAASLLNIHGGFLPRQGQERAECIHEASCHITRVLDNLLDSAPGNVAQHLRAGPYPVQPTEEAGDSMRHTA
jgi:K+-sensing histidine kinase KdpD